MFKNFLQITLEKSKKIKDEIPVTCLIVDENNNIIAKAKNQVESKKNPCLHAEVIAIQKALHKRRLRDKNTKYRYLERCSLYVNLEPCIMCGYAISLARIKNVFFAARDQKFGFFSQNINSSHKVQHFQMMEEDGKGLIDAFFSSRRN